MEIKPEYEQNPRLCVEGTNDVHAIAGLLIRNGVNWQQPAKNVYFHPTESDRKVLDSILVAHNLLRIQQAVGFVVDADQSGTSTSGDSGFNRRWQAVRDRLNRLNDKHQLQLTIPDVFPSEGLILVSPTFQARLGVWIMPNNQDEGTLENFLQEMVDITSGLYRHAVTSTHIAKGWYQADFGRNDYLKATLRTWLAWQKEPGEPYGKAIGDNKNFQHDTALALRFVAWFRELFGIQNELA